jgi:glutamate/tyrosine decarboxylase-like PLP-dependent enzyme
MPAATAGDTVDPYTTTAQWSRRAIGLKVFMALAELGINGFAALIEHQAQMGDYLRERLAKLGWEVVNETTLPVICFTHPTIKQGKLSTNQVLHTSFNTNESDIECLLEEIEYARQSNL